MDSPSDFGNAFGSSWSKRCVREPASALIACEGVESSGLKWNLHGDELRIGRKTSQSNEAVSDLVTVSCESGNLFRVCTKIIFALAFRPFGPVRWN